MKVVGIEIKSTEAILVVLERDGDGNITQSKECIKFGIKDSQDNNQVRQFMKQVKVSLNNINPDTIGLLARNGKAKGMMTPSPFSFKLEALFQLYDKKEVTFIWPQTISAFLKKNPRKIEPEKIYQDGAFNVAYYLLNQ